MSHIGSEYKYNSLIFYLKKIKITKESLFKFIKRIGFCFYGFNLRFISILIMK